MKKHHKPHQSSSTSATSLQYYSTVGQKQCSVIRWSARKHHQKVKIKSAILVRILPAKVTARKPQSVRKKVRPNLKGERTKYYKYSTTTTTGARVQVYSTTSADFRRQKGLCNVGEGQESSRQRRAASGGPGERPREPQGLVKTFRQSQGLVEAARGSQGRVESFRAS